MGSMPGLGAPRRCPLRIFASLSFLHICLLLSFVSASRATLQYISIDSTEQLTPRSYSIPCAGSLSIATPSSISAILWAARVSAASVPGDDRVLTVRLKSNLLGWPGDGTIAKLVLGNSSHRVEDKSTLATIIPSSQIAPQLRLELLCDRVSSWNSRQHQLILDFSTQLLLSRAIGYFAVAEGDQLPLDFSSLLNEATYLLQRSSLGSSQHHRSARQAGYSLIPLGFYPLEVPIIALPEQLLPCPNPAPNPLRLNVGTFGLPGSTKALLVLLTLRNVGPPPLFMAVSLLPEASFGTTLAIQSVTGTPDSKYTTSLSFVGVNNTGDFWAGVAYCAAGGGDYSLQIQGFFAPISVGGVGGGYRLNMMPTRVLTAALPYTRYVWGVIIASQQSTANPATIFAWTDPSVYGAFLNDSSTLLSWAVWRPNDVLAVSHSFVAKLGDANGLYCTPSRVGSTTIEQWGSFDPVGSDFFQLMLSPNIRLVDSRGGNTSSIFTSILQPLPITKGNVPTALSSEVPPWAEALLCFLDFATTDATPHNSGSVFINGIPRMTVAQEHFGGDFLIMPINPGNGTILIEISFSGQSTDSIVVDCFGFTGTQPVVDDSAPTWSDLLYQPLPGIVRLIDTALYSVQASRNATGLAPGVIYEISALDVVRAVGSLPGFPRAMTCTISTTGATSSLSIWDPESSAVAPSSASVINECGNGCSSSATVKLSSRGTFAIKFMTLNDVRIDVTGFYYIYIGMPWTPFSGSTVTFNDGTYVSLLSANRNAAAVTYIATSDATPSVVAYTIWETPIADKYPDYAPTLAASVYPGSNTAWSGITLVRGGAAVMSGICVSSCSFSTATAQATGFYSAIPTGNSLKYTAFGLPVTVPVVAAGPISILLSSLADWNVSSLIDVQYVVSKITVRPAPTAAGAITAGNATVFSYPPGSPSSLNAEIIIPLTSGMLQLNVSDPATTYTLAIVGYFASSILLTTAPPTTTPAPTTHAPATSPPTTLPRPSVPPGACSDTKPTPTAQCVGGAWWIPSLEQTGMWNISYEPVVIGTDLILTSESVTVITPTQNSTIFIVVEGTAEIHGTLIVDLGGRNYSATYTTMAVVRAGELQGGFDTITVGNSPKGCEKYSAWTAQTGSSINAVLLREDSACGEKQALSKWAAIAGGAVFGATILLIAIILLLFRFGVLSRTSYLMMQPDRNEAML